MKKQIEINGTRYEVDAAMPEEEIADFRSLFAPRFAAPEAVTALRELAQMVWQNPGTGASNALADMLRSLYNGEHKCDLSNIQRLDVQNRKRFCLVLEHIGHEPLWDYSIREAFHAAGGDAAVRWFHSIGMEEEP